MLNRILCFFEGHQWIMASSGFDEEPKVRCLLCNTPTIPLSELRRRQGKPYDKEWEQEVIALAKKSHTDVGKRGM